MERLPNPPARLPPPRKWGDFHVCKPGTRFWRIYFLGGDHPTSWNEFRHFGPTSSRFDHHTPPRQIQERGILYATTGGDAIPTALAEVFQETRHIDRHRREPWLVAIESVAPVKLVNTHGYWPIRVGANMAINSGPREKSRAWSQAIYRDYEDADGIWYPSSLTNQPAIALFERAHQAIPGKPVFHEPLASPKILAGLSVIAKRFRFTLS